MLAGNVLVGLMIQVWSELRDETWGAAQVGWSHCRLARGGVGEGKFDPGTRRGPCRSQVIPLKLGLKGE